MATAVAKDEAAAAKRKIAVYKESLAEAKAFQATQGTYATHNASDYDDFLDDALAQLDGGGQVMQLSAGGSKVVIAQQVDEDVENAERQYNKAKSAAARAAAEADRAQVHLEAMQWIESEDSQTDSTDDSEEA